MPIVNLLKHQGFEMPTNDLYDLFNFCKKREAARKRKESGLPRPWTIDPILDQGKFCNIFREDDKVSKSLFRFYEGSVYDAWRHAVIGRFINRSEVIDLLFPLPQTNVQEYIKDKLATVYPLINSRAYQLHPQISYHHGFKSAKEFLLNAIYDRTVDKTFEALHKSNRIVDAVDNVNQAFGGHATFYLFQAVLDIAQTNPDVIDPDSDPYIGMGAEAAVGAFGSLDAIVEGQAKHWRTAKRQIHKFDAEHIACEFRKYCLWQRDGVTKRNSYKGI